MRCFKCRRPWPDALAGVVTSVVHIKRRFEDPLTLGPAEKCPHCRGDIGRVRATYTTPVARRPKVNPKVVVAAYRLIGSVDDTAISLGLSRTTVGRILRREKVRTKTTRRLYRHDGSRLSLMAWSKDPRCKVKFNTLCDRVRRGWPVGEAIATPAGGKRSS
jgi:hypothetical protein